MVTKTTRTSHEPAEIFKIFTLTKLAQLEGQIFRITKSTKLEGVITEKKNNKR